MRHYVKLSANGANFMKLTINKLLRGYRDRQFFYTHCCKSTKRPKTIYVFPMPVELVEKDSKNYQLVHDYNLWFSNL